MDDLEIVEECYLCKEKTKEENWLPLIHPKGLAAITYKTREHKCPNCGHVMRIGLLRTHLAKIEGGE